MEISLHPVAEQGPMLDRYQGRFVGPILDHFAGAPPDPIGEVQGIVPQSGEKREEMRPGDDVDRVELDNPDPIHDPPEVTDVDLACGPRVGKTLSSQGNPTGLSDCESAHGNERVSGRAPGSRQDRPREICH